MSLYHAKNLAYAGGGPNTYGDVKTLTNATGGSTSFTNPNYYVVPSTTNYTTEPTEPSTSTDGTGQYGYLYNWCGAMGGQATAACANATTPTPNASISVCPAGWRLPTGNYGGEFDILNQTINYGYTSISYLLPVWLVQQSGMVWGSSFMSQGSNGYYWSSTQGTASSDAHVLYVSTNNVQQNQYLEKRWGIAVRCVAN